MKALDIEGASAKEKLFTITRAGFLTDTQFRLCAVAWAREVMPHARERSAKSAVEVAERFALGKANIAELRSAHEAAHRATWNVNALSADRAAAATTLPDARSAAWETLAQARSLAVWMWPTSGAEKPVNERFLELALRVINKTL